MSIPEGASVEHIVDTVLQSRKYRFIYRPTIERIVRDVASRHPAKEVEKVVKRKLHQTWGAYFTRPQFNKILSHIQTQINEGVDVQSIILQLLKLQTSTNERIPILNEFYQKIFEITGTPMSVIEPACGINALTYFWMNQNIHYTGFDVDQEEIDFINSVFHTLDVGQKASVNLGDVFSSDLQRADVGQLLKVLPLLEHQQKGSSLELLKKMPCKWVVISYPTRSITGKQKGMTSFYTEYFTKLVQNEPWSVTKLLFPSELVFIIRK